MNFRGFFFLAATPALEEADSNADVFVYTFGDLGFESFRRLRLFGPALDSLLSSEYEDSSSDSSTFA